jgi:cbb3-type cytochrome oxidase maturation protein
MNILLILIPLALALGGLGLVAFGLVCLAHPRSGA